ncbi:MAG: hypothetical protein IT294_01320 [Deltaproteobacteria bacterium]|nr:hypothetical protein [Deltaproteobacteria bacterium]
MRSLLVACAALASVALASGAAERGPFAVEADGPASLRAGSPAQPEYTVVDLGTLGGASEAFAISNNGKVAGLYTPGSYEQAFLWEDGVMQGLGTLGGATSQARGVNDAGQVVGYSLKSSGYNHAFLWQNGAMQDLGTLGGANSMSMAFAINNAGQVAGHSTTAAYKLHAFRWSGGMADLGTLGGDGSHGYGINENGQVVGGSFLAPYPDNTWHAFLSSGAMQDLGTAGWDSSTAYGINDNGQVVGRIAMDDYPLTYNAFLYSGGMQGLGGTESTAWDINNDGLIVGESGGQAVLWAGGQMTNLDSLIDASLGWTLQSARAINENGHIVGRGSFNGQTRAFLLKPSVYHWINPNGGGWHVATNWDPQGDPGDGATVIFDLSGQYSVYSVDVSALVSSTSGRALNALSVARMIIAADNFVQLDNMNLNMVYDKPENPSLQVNDGGTAAVNSGTATFSHAVIGGSPPANPANPPLARLQVLGAGASLAGTGRLTVGEDGKGELFVTGGGQLTSAESRLGMIMEGVADVGGNGSVWNTGNLAVGHVASGTLDIKLGGRVNSDSGYVAFGADSDGSKVTIDGMPPGGQASMWALQNDLILGEGAFAYVQALNGADLFVFEDVQIKNGSLWIRDHSPSGDPSDLDVLGNVFVGGWGSFSLLALKDAARGDIEGNVFIGQDGRGALLLYSDLASPLTTRLDAVDPQAGLCVIGAGHDGTATVNRNSMLRCRNMQLGQVGGNGSGLLTVNGADVSVLEVLQVGSAGGGAGRIDLAFDGNAAAVSADGAYVAPNGVVAGAGTLEIGSLGLLNDGQAIPGTITVLNPVRLAASPESIMRRDAAPVAVGRTGLGAGALETTIGTIVVDGDFTQGQAGSLVIEVGGTAPGAFDMLDVRGAVRLGGTLVLRFVDGYLPQPGDAFAVLPGEKFKGVFDAVRVENVGPGFDFALAPGGAALTLTARSAATPPLCRDPADGDGDGVGCTDNCPAVANAEQADADEDQHGDACDDCTDGSPLRKPVLGLKKGKLVLKGALSLPAAPLLQPAATGARVTIEDGTGAAVAVFDAPPGAFDAATKTGWKKLAYTSRTGELRGLKLGQAKKKPGTVKIDLKAVLPGVDPSAIVPPITARILLDGLTLPTSLCGHVRFAGPAGVNPLCALKRGALDCRVRKPQ